tara:strand:+ start:5979 stop:6713 length:735 start_codon:yes stop_codon:yes gene_type:complete
MSLKERKDVINYFVDKNNYNSYLEIGLYGAPRTFNNIKCKIKNSVDPNPAANAEYCTTSDEFFNDLEDDLLMIPPDFKWDIIFIDGDHYHETVDRDVPNALNHLSDNGTIVMHDCAYGDQTKTRSNPRGTDVWKSWVRLRCTRPDLKMNVVNIDWGVGVIQRGTQKVWDKDPLEKCLTNDYFVSLMDENSVNPLDSYSLYSNGQFLTDIGEGKIGTYIDDVHPNLTRTHLMPFITKERFYEIYE